MATAAAPLLIGVYAHAITGPEHHLMVIFAYFFIPQIFFYAVSSLAGGVLNARVHFAAPMWTPVLNHLVVTGVLVVFIAGGGIGVTPTTISADQVRLLGFGTTLGVVVQTVAMIPVLRRAGFWWRPRFDFRRAEVSEIGRMAGPLFGYILTTQAAFLVVQNVANKASVHAPYDGFSSYSYAWQLSHRDRLRRHRRAAGGRRAHQPPARSTRPRGHRRCHPGLLLPGLVPLPGGRYGLG